MAFSATAVCCSRRPVVRVRLLLFRCPAQQPESLGASFLSAVDNTRLHHLQLSLTERALFLPRLYRIVQVVFHVVV